MQSATILAVFVFVLIISLAATPRRVSVDGFFAGLRQDGRAPGLWTLVLSQVTTWIFARSLMNSAILGYFYGIWGVLAYAAYYGSFLSGGYIVGRLRETGARSVQEWLREEFGPAGNICYNVVVGLRLLSEVFANLLVVGLIFAAALPEVGLARELSILLVAVLGLAYSAWGGLSASLRSDVLQMAIFLVVFVAAFFALVTMPGFDLGAVLSSSGTSGSWNGQVLLLVAFLQVFSYPVHDPVMMDRGFLADRSTTRASFIHAFWISFLCIIGFGFFGIEAALQGAAYEGELIGTWALMFPAWIWIALMVSLLVSALSTLDSALASASRLAVDELRLVPRTLTGGRVVMAVFMVAGTVLTLWGNQSLFDAVAVSGTASLFLTPVLVTRLVLGRAVPLWAYITSFVAAILGAFAYFARDWPLVARLLPDGHKYEILLIICIVVLCFGFLATFVGARMRRELQRS